MGVFLLGQNRFNVVIENQTVENDPHNSVFLTRIDGLTCRRLVSRNPGTSGFVCYGEKDQNFGIRNVLFEDCKSWGGSDGFTAHTDDTGEWHVGDIFHYVRCEAYEAREQGFDIGRDNRTPIPDVLMQSCIAANGNGGAVIMADGGQVLDCLFRDNTGYGLRLGIGCRVILIDRTWFIGNGAEDINFTTTEGAALEDIAVRRSYFRALEGKTRANIYPRAASGLRRLTIEANIFQNDYTPFIEVENGMDLAALALQCDYNRYYCRTGSAGKFKIGGKSYDFAGWQALGFDLHSTFEEVYMATSAKASFTLGVTEAPGFFLTVVPVHNEGAQGGVAVYQVSVQPKGGYGYPVNLAVLGLPAGVTAEFAKNPVAPGETVEMALRIAEGVPVTEDDAPLALEVEGVGVEE